MSAQPQSASFSTTPHLYFNTTVSTESTSQPSSQSTPTSIHHPTRPSSKISLIRCGCGWGGIKGGDVDAFFDHVRGHHGINVRLGQVS